MTRVSVMPREAGIFEGGILGSRPQRAKSARVYGWPPPWVGEWGQLLMPADPLHEQIESGIAGLGLVATDCNLAGKSEIISMLQGVLGVKQTGYADLATCQAFKQKVSWAPYFNMVNILDTLGLPRSTCAANSPTPDCAGMIAAEETRREQESKAEDEKSAGLLGGKGIYIGLAVVGAGVVYLLVRKKKR